MSLLSLFLLFCSAAVPVFMSATHQINFKRLRIFLLFIPQVSCFRQFRWGNVLVHQNLLKLKLCLHFDQIRTWRRCFNGLQTRFLRHVHPCESHSIRFYKNTDHLQQSWANKIEQFFGKWSSCPAFLLDTFVKFIQLFPETLQEIYGFGALFV